MAERDELPPIKFEALAEALLARADTLVPMWLPGGVRRGHEYVCGSLSGGSGTSTSVNLTDGMWADFAGDDRGKDLISLYAAIHGLSMGKAAVEVARAEGLEDVAGVMPAPHSADAPPRPPRPPEPPKPAKVDEGWQPMIPVPPHAPAATFNHYQRKAEDIVHTAEYRMDGQLLGYVVRFRTSDGGKDTLPYTWCTSARDGASRWHWKTWNDPRPLYFPGGLSPAGFEAQHGNKPMVILVEGEKKAGILQDLLDAGMPGIYLVASWVGGCKAWKKAMWTWLNGCDVLLWPDCDGKREPLTRAEKAGCADDVALQLAEAAKPLLPADKQPGMGAMLGIGAALVLNQCKVQILPIPEPLEVPDGWDCADAIQTDGWDLDKVVAFFGRAQPLPVVAGKDEPKAAAGGSGGGKKIDRPGGPEASEDDFNGDGDAFQGYLDWLSHTLSEDVHKLGVNRKMVITALRKSPHLKDCLGLNTLTGAPSTQKPWPWRDKAGPLEEGDALRLGDWLSTTYKIKAASKAALDEAIDTVADERRFHPIQDWLRSLKWDGVSRIDKWFIHVLGKGPVPDAPGTTELELKPKLRKYYELVGRFTLLGLVNRAMEPGCKFDYSPVLEGLAGRGKSSLVKELVGKEFFSDTHFDIGSGKDGMEQLEGLWGYELSELTALRKADSEQVKQFFSSTVDRFRGAYGKYVQAHPRQCLIFCTTNKKRYLYDQTGNRRYWPVWISEYVKLEWLAKWRNQLFAEAMHLYKQRTRFTPTPEEDAELFKPEQDKRMVGNSVQSRMYELLTREGAPGDDGKASKEININTKFITLDRLIYALGADAAKSSSLLEKNVQDWLEANGWIYKRAGSKDSTGARPYGFFQPAVWPPVVEDDEEEIQPPAGDPMNDPAQGSDHEDDDDVPF